MEEYKKHYQVGNIIKITQEPKMAKRHGFLTGTEHVIRKPPEGKSNTAMGVWLKNKYDTLVLISFYNYVWTGKIQKHKKVNIIK